MPKCVCKICGKEFIGGRVGAMTCSKECRKIAQRGYSRRWRMENKEKSNEQRRMQRLMRNIEIKPDTIVAIGYAERQMAETLKMAGKVKI